MRSVRSPFVALACALSSLALWACEEPGDGPVSMGTPPPAGVEYLDADVGPEAVMFSGAKIVGGKATAVPSDLVGLWVPKPGWSGVVEKATRQGGGMTLGLKFYATGILGNEFWVLCKAPANCGVSEGDTVAVQGKIENVEVNLMTPTPTYRIILDKVYILEHQKR